MTHQEKQTEIKQRILGALFECLEKKPLDSLTADEIAKAADVSKRTLYKYYTSKKEMMLALVFESFKDLAERIHQKMLGLKSEDPWEKIACIGREYMRYALNEKQRAKFILDFDETEYVQEYGEWVQAIQTYSNQFELMPFIRDYFDYHSLKPNYRIESMTLYFWAEAQGLAALLLSKRSWIREYYGVDENALIEEHLAYSKKILGEKG